MNTNMQPIIINTIPISYETDDVNVSFNIEFGNAKNSTEYKESIMRVNYNKPYDIEKYETNGTNMFRLLAEEGAFVLKVSDVLVTPKNNIYKRTFYNGYADLKYGITTVLDMNVEPIYTKYSNTPSNNVERDGDPWVVKNNKCLKVDQNGNAKFQWSTAKALAKDVDPTPEQELMGVEKRHDNSGMIYITFQAMYVESEHIIEKNEENIMRGFNSGSETTRGITRGFNSNSEIRKSEAARVGYGNSATTKSKSVDTIMINNSRYILPIRIRTIGESSSNTICAKNLTSAMRVEKLQKQTTTIPDFD